MYFTQDTRHLEDMYACVRAEDDGEVMDGPVVSRSASHLGQDSSLLRFGFDDLEGITAI